MKTQSKRSGRTMRKLNPRQARIFCDLISGEYDDIEIAYRNNTTPGHLSRFLNSKRFKKSFDEYIKRQEERTAVILTTSNHMAAQKLIDLLGSEKEETARKVCLGIIEATKEEEPEQDKDTGPKPVLPPPPSEEAYELLAMIGRDGR